MAKVPIRRPTLHDAVKAVRRAAPNSAAQPKPKHVLGQYETVLARLQSDTETELKTFIDSAGEDGTETTLYAVTDEVLVFGVPAAYWDQVQETYGLPEQTIRTMRLAHTKEAAAITGDEFTTTDETDEYGLVVAKPEGFDAGMTAAARRVEAAPDVRPSEAEVATFIDEDVEPSSERETARRLADAIGTD